MSLLQNSNAMSTASAYDLTDSLRFRSSASAYLSRTPTTASNQKTWTWSGWVKRGSISRESLFSCYFANNARYTYWEFDASHRFHLFIANDNGANPATYTQLITTAVYRDPSAWYHIVVAVDTTQATSSDRANIYINGEKITAFSTEGYPVQNINTFINSTYNHYIGSLDNTQLPFDGYMTEVNFVDGQQLTPADFGQTDTDTGVWKPKKYTGTYGTNGFYLNFSDGSAATATALGKDYSGNSNNWTPNNIVVSGVNIAYSNYFNGTSHVQTPASTNLALGSGDFTVELWFKKTGGPTQQSLFAYGSSFLEFDNSKIRAITNPSDINGTTTIVNNVWYHAVWTRVSGQVRLYLNGTLEASGSNSTNITYNTPRIGRRVNDTTGFTGYISNVRVVKGTAVYTSNFTPSTAPLTAISGTQLLTLQSSSLVDNSSNSFSLTNSGTTITSSEHPFPSSSDIDIMSDVPTLTDEDTGNYATLNPNDNSGGTISNGNLTQTNTGVCNTNGTIGLPSTGKFYWEIQCVTAAGGVVGIGASSAENGAALSNLTKIYGYSPNGSKYINTTSYSYGATYTSGDFIGIAFDCDTRQLTFYKNNVSQGLAFTVDSGYTYLPQFHLNNTTINANFGQRPFAYTPPTGYKKLNTYNLPDSSIEDGSQYFDTKLWAGNGGTQSITGVEFSPDFVWIKSRTDGGSHTLQDSVRGVGSTTKLSTNSTNAQNNTAADATDSRYGYITALNSDGFTVYVGTTPSQTNKSGQNYVGWSWRGSDSAAVSNNNGNVTTTVSANPTAGFSIVKWTGTSSGTTMGHGLGATPKVIISKPISTSGAWHSYFSEISNMNNGYIVLNTGDAFATGITIWGGSPNTTTFTQVKSAYANLTGQTYIAYCFADVEGFSKMGSYTGNGSTDGTFVYTGFRPVFVLVKNSTTGGLSWVINDTSRNTYNECNKDLIPNSSSAESTPSPGRMDILSNGFKIRSSANSVNQSGANHVYMAFAENPFKNSLAR